VKRKGTDVKDGGNAEGFVVSFYETEFRILHFTWEGSGGEKIICKILEGFDYYQTDFS